MQQFGPLTAGDVDSTVLRLIRPMAVTTILIAATSVVDTILVARLGHTALASLGFAVPIIGVASQLMLGWGVGITAVCAEQIGAERFARARLAATATLLSGALVTAAFACLCFAGGECLFRMLGASGAALTAAIGYFRLWLLGAVPLYILYAGTAALRAIGETSSTARLWLIAAGVNAALDPLLIYGAGPWPGLGVAGAGLATTLGNAIAAGMTLRRLVTTQVLQTGAHGEARAACGEIASVAGVALPAFVSYAALPLSIGVLTALVEPFGAEFVAALGVATRLQLFVRTLPLACAGGLSPFAGQHRQIRASTRIQAAVAYVDKLNLRWTAFWSLALMAAAFPIARGIDPPTATLAAVTFGLAIVPVGYLFDARILISNVVFNNTGRAGLTGFAGVLRALGTVAAAGVGVRLAGSLGVFAALPLASVFLDKLALRWRQNALTGLRPAMSLRLVGNSACPDRRAALKARPKSELKRTHTNDLQE